MKQIEPFLFAVPRNATLESRQRVPQHVAKHYGVMPSTLFHVRSDDAMHLYGGLREVQS